jgi:hypothetical protein
MYVIRKEGIFPFALSLSPMMYRVGVASETFFSPNFASHYGQHLSQLAQRLMFYRMIRQFTFKKSCSSSRKMSSDLELLLLAPKQDFEVQINTKMRR